jgi:hypothetical protein
MMPRENQLTRLDISGVSAAIWPAIHDELDWFPDSLETLTDGG